MKIPKLRWIIAIMLFLATSINYADRLALSVVSSDLRAEFHMTERDYSYVVTAFLIAYAVMYAGSGYVVDRLGTRAGFAVSSSIIRGKGIPRCSCSSLMASPSAVSRPMMPKGARSNSTRFS